MSETASDLSVVIPTRDRWDILASTLRALQDQSVTGFEVIVVVDGDDQVVPGLDADRVIVAARGGPGAARNRGVAASGRPLVLFLGDDVVPTARMVERHVAAHRAHPSERVAVLGHTDWHPDVADAQHNRWLQWSGSQFDYAAISGDDADWGRFYSSNVSLKRSLFEAAGGFDEAFRFDYEDLDLAYRLHGRGLVLRYERQAVGHHLHFYDWAGLVGRYHSRGQAERQMAQKHPWFQPWFHARLADSQARSPVSSVWPRLAAWAPARPGRLRRRLEARGTTWYHQQLYAPFFGAWRGQDDVAELKAYLGDSFDETALRDHQRLVDDEEGGSANERSFYRTSRAYLYDLTMFALWGTKEPYLAALRRLLPVGASLLDYGCGIGGDGLRLLQEGYRVSFADFANPSTEYLRWRLQRRGLEAPVFDVEGNVPGGFDAVYSFDVIEHVEDPFAFLAELERRAGLVMVNFLEPAAGDTHLHRPLPVRRLLDRATRRGLVFYRRFGGRSHLVAYRSARAPVVPAAASLLTRAGGAIEVVAERATRLPPPPATGS